MMHKQDQAWPVETLMRSYVTEAGYWSEPYLHAQILAINEKAATGAVGGTIDCNGAVPILVNVPITLSGQTNGQNITNIYITPAADCTIVVYWTKYQGFVWQES